jgi:hypothetical protein
MKKKEIKRRIREEMRDEPAYDERTRRLKERIERGRREAQAREAS